MDNNQMNPYAAGQPAERRGVFAGQQNNPYEPEQTNTQHNGMIGISITGMICGILSILCCITSIYGVFMGVVGLVFSLIAIVKNYEGRGMAIAGVVCSAIGFIFSVVITLIMILE